MSENTLNTYKIILEGCDDTTVFDMELTDDEYNLLVRVSEKANETSTYMCEPRMYVQKITTEKEKNDGSSIM